MKKRMQPTQGVRISVICVLVCLLTSMVEAGTTIGFGSSVGATNLKSDGVLMEAGFMFQLGTFEDGFAPTSGNTDQWLSAWRPASDAVGDPLDGNTAVYRTDELGVGFPAGLRINSFTSSVLMDHNEPPFRLGGQLYVWGYDQRATPGAAEWILITSPMWIWPDGSANLPATSYAVSGASVAVIGEIMGVGFEMKTAAVTVPESSADHYEGWLASHFSVVVRGDGNLESGVWGEHADPDEDGLSNLLEYFAGTDPNVVGMVEVLGEPLMSGDEITVDYRKSNSAIGVVGEVEWSTDLENWSREGVVESEELEGETHGTVRARWQIGSRGQAFFRLRVQRAL